MASILRGVRAEKKITQGQLGTLIGRYFASSAIPQQTISRWESEGTVPGCYLGAIAQVCGVNPERMMV